MSAKHTPGPWKARVQRSNDGMDLGWIIEHSNGRIGWASLAYADTNKEAGQEDPARAANARLIAAAPDLLEALSTYVQTISEAGGGDKDLFMAAIRSADDKARAAIAKATGGAA